MIDGEKVTRFSLVVCFLVCPLLFFTNLTRNPYITQISLLNILMCVSGAAYFINDALSRGCLRLPRTPLDLPLLGWAAVCVLTLAVSYFGHPSFYRPAIFNEGVRALLFVAANSIVPFYLSAACAKRGPAAEASTPVQWAVFTIVWGALWTFFPQMRGGPSGGIGVWSHVWDPYGAALWAGGIAAAARLCRRGHALDFIHLFLAVGFLASVYGVAQYFNLELIWPHVLNPYGGRAVSTFGNPNFLSSFLVILVPIAAVLALGAKEASGKIIYGGVFLALEAALLCSLTRSSWIGALFAVGLLALSRDVRERVLAERRTTGLLIGVGLVMALFWPQSTVGGAYTPSVLGRLTEMRAIGEKEVHYSPFHQRLLIWTCAWLMGDENPLTGKGWGAFELFYPFYQGHVFNHIDFLVRMRTHANNCHNEILEIWSQTGLLGLGVAAWIWTAFFTAARRFWAPGRLRDASLELAGAAGAAGMLADNLLNVSLHFAVPGLLFWWVAGLVMGRGAQREDLWRRTRRPRSAAAGAAVLAAVFAAAGWYWVRVWNREVHYFAGFKYLRQANAQAAAIKELELSKAWGPPEVNAVYELGNAYARNQRFEDAVRTYGDALRANAGYDEIFFNIGTILTTKLGRVEEGLKYYNVAWWINPISNEVYLNMSSLYFQDPARYRDQAIALLKGAVHFFPDNPNHWNNLGYLESQAGELARAEDAYVRALTINPDMSMAERNLGASLARSRHPEPAILKGLADLRKLEALVSKADFSAPSLALSARVAAVLPEVPRVRFYHGSLLLANGKTAEGAAELEWVVAREPANLSARINLGNAYLSLRRTEEALAQFRGALSIDPGNVQARQRLRSLGFSN